MCFRVVYQLIPDANKVGAEKVSVAFMKLRRTSKGSNSLFFSTHGAGVW